MGPGNYLQYENRTALGLVADVRRECASETSGLVDLCKGLETAALKTGTGLRLLGRTRVPLVLFSDQRLVTMTNMGRIYPLHTCTCVGFFEEHEQHFDLEMWRNSWVFPKGMMRA